MRVYQQCMCLVLSGFKGRQYFEFFVLFVKQTLSSDPSFSLTSFLYYLCYISPAAYPNRANGGQNVRVKNLTKVTSMPQLYSYLWSPSAWKTASPFSRYVERSTDTSFHFVGTKNGAWGARLGLQRRWIELCCRWGRGMAWWFAMPWQFRLIANALQRRKDWRLQPNLGCR